MPITPTCTWRLCHRQAVWTVTAGQPGTGTGYAAAFACPAHRRDVEHRTSRLAQAQPAHAERLPDQPTPTGDQEQLAIDL